MIVDPSNGTHIFAGKLSRTLDPFGNRIEYRYERDAEQTEDTHRWDQLYLAEIRFGRSSHCHSGPFGQPPRYTAGPRARSRHHGPTEAALSREKTQKLMIDRSPPIEQLHTSANH